MGFVIANCRFTRVLVQRSPQFQTLPGRVTLQTSIAFPVPHRRFTPVCMQAHEYPSPGWQLSKPTPPLPTSHWSSEPSQTSLTCPCLNSKSTLTKVTNYLPLVLCSPAVREATTHPYTSPCWLRRHYVSLGGGSSSAESPPRLLSRVWEKQEAGRSGGSTAYPFPRVTHSPNLGESHWLPRPPLTYRYLGRN